MRELKVGSDFSGVGAFDQALKRLEIEYKTVFACDMDKYARQTYIENYGEPEYYPENVYNREIPKESLDIYMTSPPCQSFSLAGSRKGEDSDNGVLFYNSHEFIIKNKPRFFIFENVKGLLSDNKGKTFQRWIDYLSKSVNGTAIMFPHEESANYHVYHQVLNSKDYGVPQNRERIFIIGIRDDQDNNFLFPPKEHLSKRLKDLLEEEVEEKYFLSDKMLKHLLTHPRSQDFITEDIESVNCITANYHKQSSDLQYLNVGKYDKEIRQSISQDICTCIDASYYKGFGVRQGKCRQVVATNKSVKVNSATKKGYETAKEGDSINFQNAESKTRRGRVGKGVAQTLDTSCNQATITEERIRRLTPRECFRLQDFPDTFKMPCSDSQMYKQAGNSITVRVLEKILNKLKF